MNKYTVIKKIDEYLSCKDYVKARKLIRNDLKRFGTKDEYYMYLGLASIEPADRVKNYEKAVNANPNNLDALINLGNALDELGDYDRALECYNKALEIDSICALVYNNRGYTYYKMKNYENALQDYDRALLLNPKLQIAQDNRTKLLAELEGNVEYAQVVKNSQEQAGSFKFYFNLGVAEARLGKYDEAEKAYDKSLELNPDYVPCYIFRGILEHSRGNFEKASLDYTKAIELDENSIDAYFNRAQLILAKEKEINEDELRSALQDLQKAVELDSNFIDAYYSIAVIQKKLGEYKEAVKTLDKLLEITPDSVNARALKKLLMKKYLN